MKALRIKIRQNQASFTREESITNKMTYPLAPYSTIIGALHNACSYTSYHPMDISVQGKYATMNREIYVNHGILNNRQNDRNILIYLPNPDLISTGYIKVGEGLKSQGNDFLSRKSVRIDDENLYQEYLSLNDRKKQLDIERKEIKSSIDDLKEEIKDLKKEQKSLDKKSEKYLFLKEKIKKIQDRCKQEDEQIKEKIKTEVDIPLSHFKTLVKAPRYQEVLYDLEQVIHVSAKEDVIKDIEDNILNFVSLGRSEDFVEVLECSRTELKRPDGQYFLKNNYKLYANAKRVIFEQIYDESLDEDKSYFFVGGSNRLGAEGTVYYINKDYAIQKNKRVFNKIACLYSSKLGVDSESLESYIDDEGYIVDLN